MDRKSVVRFLSACLGFITLFSMSLTWVSVHPDAAYAAKKGSFSVFVGRDRRLKIINTTVKLPPGDTYLSDGVLSVTLISPVNYMLRKLDVPAEYYLDRSYTLVNLPGVLNNKIWIVGNDADLLNTSSSFVQFEISDTARIYVLYDGNASSLPSWMSGFTATGDVVTTTNPTADTFLVYRRITTKGTIRLGGNDGAATGAKCNYVVVVRRPANGDLGSSEQIATTEMQLPRAGHKLVMLNSGNVLIVGGVDTSSTGGTLVSTCELYDSRAQTFITTGVLAQGRNNPAAVKLSDGRVLVIGGDLGGVARVGEGGQAATGITALSSCELYDPATGLWSAAGDMGWRRRMPEAIKLADGRVFVSGGVNDTYGWGIGSTEIYDPSTNLWTAGPDMLALGTYNTGSYPFTPGMRYGHRMALLPDGRVLIAGGLWHGPELIDYAMEDCDIYDPVANTMTVGEAMNAPHGRFGFVPIGNGRFLAMGGLYYQEPNTVPSYYFSTADAEIYDASTNRWTLVAPLPSGMYDFAVVSPDLDRAMIFDGFDVLGTEAGDIILYDGNLNNWTQVGNLVTSRSFPLSNGADVAVDVGGKDYFLCGGVHFSETTGQTSFLTTGERFKY